MKQLLMRNADVNYQSSKNGNTALHIAIEKLLPLKYVKFLLKNGANPHIEDHTGKDCCDKAKGIQLYSQVEALNCFECHNDPSLRIKQYFTDYQKSRQFELSELNKNKTDSDMKQKLIRSEETSDVETNF